MKNKKLSFAIITILILTGCSPDDEEYQKDDILSNTDWKQETGGIIVMEDGGQIYDDKTMFNAMIASGINYYHEESRIEKEKIYNAESPYNCLSLKFNIGTCTLSNICYNRSLKVKTIYIYDVYTFPEQQQWAYGYVTNNGIYTKDNYKLFELANYQKQYFNRSESSKAELQNDLKSSKEEFQFLRNGSEIIMTNKNKKIYGELDKEKWEIRLIQIEPEKKDFGKLSFK